MLNRKPVIYFAILLVGALAVSCTPAAAPAAPSVTPVPNTATSPPEPTETEVPPTATATKAPTPTEASPPPIEFTFVTKDQASPAVGRDIQGASEHIYINPGAVFYHDGEFHMFANSFTLWPTPTDIYYLNSPDGINWTVQTQEPIQLVIPFSEVGHDVGSAFVEDDGTWVMYFHTLQPAGIPGQTVNFDNGGEVGRATAPSPLGPWTVDPTPVLDRGAEGDWDERGVNWPSVIKTTEGYAMIYAGVIASNGDTQLGLAFSEDGVNWEKYNNPDTDGKYAHSDPILMDAPDKFVARTAGRPELAKTDNGFVLMYASSALHRRFMVTSPDLIHWDVYSKSVMSNVLFPFSANNWDNALLYHDGVLYFYIELGTVADGTDIFLATATYAGP